MNNLLVAIVGVTIGGFAAYFYRNKDRASRPDTLAADLGDKPPFWFDASIDIVVGVVVGLIVSVWVGLNTFRLIGLYILAGISTGIVDLVRERRRRPVSADQLTIAQRLKPILETWDNLRRSWGGMIGLTLIVLHLVVALLSPTLVRHQILEVAFQAGPIRHPDRKLLRGQPLPRYACRIPAASAFPDPCPVPPGNGLFPPDSVLPKGS